MNINPGELTSRGYVELDTLHHNDLVPFIQKYMKKRTTFSAMYFLANLFCFGLVGYLAVADIDSLDYNLGDRVVYFSYGIALAFALLPLHEYIHVVAYKSQGAKNTSYEANIMKFYFMALADGFVASGNEFRFIALAPFVFISTCLVASLFLVSGIWVITISGILLAHTAMCSGDFGLLSYFDFHKDKDVVTYDDIKMGVSYFFGKSKGTCKQ